MLPTTTVSVLYDGNNSTVTAYPFTWKVYLPEHIFVRVQTENGTTYDLTRGSGYTLTINENYVGGSIRTINPIPATSKVLIFRSIAPYIQNKTFPFGGEFQSLNVEQGLDLAMMAIQELAENLGRAPQVSLFVENVSASDLNLLTMEPNSILTTDGDNAIVWVPTATFTAGNTPGAISYLVPQTLTYGQRSTAARNASAWHWRAKIGTFGQDSYHPTNQLSAYGPFKSGDVLVVNCATDQAILMRDDGLKVLRLPGRLSLVCFSDSETAYWSNFLPIPPWIDNRGYPQSQFIDGVLPPVLPPDPDPIDIVIPESWAILPPFMDQA